MAAPPLPAYAASTIIVTTIADNTTTDTFCSLREAINNANSDAATSPDCITGSGNDTIIFDPSLRLGSESIVVSSTLPMITDADGLTIDGGAVLVPINGNNRYRVFRVYNGTSLTLNRILVANGSKLDSGGGAILNNGTLTITNSFFVYNRAGRGGAIYSGGKTTPLEAALLSEKVLRPIRRYPRL